MYEEPYIGQHPVNADGRPGPGSEHRESRARAGERSEDQHPLLDMLEHNGSAVHLDFNVFGVAEVASAGRQGMMTACSVHTHRA